MPLSLGPMTLGRVDEPYAPAVGDRVICEVPYRGTFTEGIVSCTNGAYVLVNVFLDGEPSPLAYYPHELKLVGREA